MHVLQSQTFEPRARARTRRIRDASLNVNHRNVGLTIYPQRREQLRPPLPSARAGQNNCICAAVVSSVNLAITHRRVCRRYRVDHIARSAAVIQSSVIAEAAATQECEHLFAGGSARQVEVSASPDVVGRERWNQQTRNDQFSPCPTKLFVFLPEYPMIL